MTHSIEKDRTFIESKYHRTDEPFNPFIRMAYHGTGYAPETGLDDLDIRSGLEVLAAEHADLPHSLQKAHAVAYILDNTRLYVSPHDYFVGIDAWCRMIAQTTIRKWEKDVFATLPPELIEFQYAARQGGALDMRPDYDHSVPDWQSILSLGFPGLLQRIFHHREHHRNAQRLNPERAAFFDAMTIEYRAILRLLERMRRCAEAQLFEKSPILSKCLAHLHDGPPTDTYEALQTIYLFFLICESVDHYQVRSLGNGLDASLRPFIQRDLASGRWTELHIRTFLSYFLMQFSAIGNYWGHPFYLGGSDEQGRCTVDDVSYLILDVYDTLHIYNPKIQIKIGAGTPAAFRRKALDMIRRGTSSIVFVCEDAMIRAMMGYGATLQEARTADISGCYEYRVRGNENVTLSIYLNLLKAVQLVFGNGTDHDTGFQLGPPTGHIHTLQTFSDFRTACLRQLDALIDQAIRFTDCYEGRLEDINPSIMLTPVCENALRRGIPAYAEGMSYNNSSLLCIGFASAVDTMMTVKKMVYDERRITLDELKAALDANWDGYEPIRRAVRRLPFKFGNHEPETDALAEAFSSYLLGRINLRPNSRGGIYKAEMHAALHFRSFGSACGASPDGRRQGDELSKNASPSVGMDRNGATALILSALKLHPQQYMEGFCLDVMLHPSAVAGEDGMKAWDALLETYRKGGGASIQFNVMDAAILRDAQEHPERYRNLQVRVCGWNVLWNNLDPQEQAAYIERAENIR